MKQLNNKCKFVSVLRIFFFFKYKLHTGQILNFGWYLSKRPETLEIRGVQKTHRPTKPDPTQSDLPGWVGV